ncbi:hypothetical protein HDU97_002062 [Phlyctochytrium planicorne]|nr:hypothetical protein HDU97_002062 [Phlyctochytrium planicorne]
MDASSRAREMGGQVGGVLKSWFTVLNPGVCLIVIASAIVEVINFVTVHSLPGCLSAKLLLGNPLRVFTLLTNSFLHPGILTLVATLALFIPLASNVERRLGSIAFVYHLIIVLGLSSGVLYVILAWFAGFASRNLYESCAQGLAPLVFALLSIECTKREGELGFLSNVVPMIAYPWILLLTIYLLSLVPFFYIKTFFIYNIAGIIVGWMYAQNLLNFLVPSSTVFTRLEDSFLFSWMIHLSTFVPHAGVITLPDSGGAYTSEQDPHASAGAAGGSGDNAGSASWFVDRFKAFTGTGGPSRSGYGALGKPDSAVDDDEEALLSAAP